MRSNENQPTHKSKRCKAANTKEKLRLLALCSSAMIPLFPLQLKTSRPYFWGPLLLLPPLFHTHPSCFKNHPRSVKMQGIHCQTPSFPLSFFSLLIILDNTTKKLQEKRCQLEKQCPLVIYTAKADKF